MKAALPAVSPLLLNLFAAQCRRYVGRNFHAVRMLQSLVLPASDGCPLVIYLNHASWWDPLICLLLARELMPKRTSFAPIDAAMLERYRLFRRLGFFGVEPETAHGARKFLQTAKAVLASPQNALWLTPQGRFMDVRERPLRLKGGLGALAVREPKAVFVPLAVELTFWTEPRAEILVAFGEPLVPGAEPARTAQEWTATFSEALEAAQDELANRSCRRDPSEWQTLTSGRSGVGGIYDAWRRLRARLRGERFATEHPAGAHK